MEAFETRRRCANAGMGSQDGRRLTDEDRRRRSSLIYCFCITTFGASKGRAYYCI